VWSTNCFFGYIYSELKGNWSNRFWIIYLKINWNLCWSHLHQRLIPMFHVLIVIENLLWYYYLSLIVSRLRKILHSLARGMPRNLLQRAEEIFPAVRERMVSVLCLCAQTRILFSCVSCFGQRNKIFCDTSVCLHNPCGEFLTLGCSHYNRVVYYVGEGSIQGEWYG
jgi:hypothetical protein